MPDRSRVYRTHALILRRRDYGDADRILTLLTPANGRIEVIAKSARKTTSRLAGHVDLFTHANMLLAEARTWDIVTEAVTVEPFRHLREDLDAISRASYVAELVDAFAESTDEPGPLWDLATFSLRELDLSAAGDDFDRGVFLDWFALRLLAISGFQPNLSTCLVCEEPLKPELNFLNIEGGGVICPRCAETLADRSGLEAVDAETLKILRFLTSRNWSEARKYHIRPGLLRRVDNILLRYLITVLERQLRSVDFLRRMQNDPRFSRSDE